MALFVVLFVLLLKVLLVGLIIGFILFVFFWLKQKLFPTHSKADEQIKKFMDDLNQYSHHSAGRKYSDNHKRDTFNSSSNQGRIIDVDPEEK